MDTHFIKRKASEYLRDVQAGCWRQINPKEAVLAIGIHTFRINHKQSAGGCPGSLPGSLSDISFRWLRRLLVNDLLLVGYRYFSEDLC